MMQNWCSHALHCAFLPTYLTCGIGADVWNSLYSLCSSFAHHLTLTTTMPITGDLALSNGDIALAEQCAQRSADLSGLLLLYTSAGKPCMYVLYFFFIVC